MRVNRGTFFIVLVLTLLVACVAVFGIHFQVDKYIVNVPGSGDMRFGIDIRGGVDAVYEPVGLDRVPTADELESARAVVETRLDQRNILDRDVTVDREIGDIIVRFPWKSDETEFNPQQAIAELGETAKLTFRDMAGNVLVDGSHVTRSVVELNDDGTGYVVGLTFDDEGKRLFAEATKKFLHQQIAIYMDETLITAPTVQNEIIDGKGVITNGLYGNESLKSASELAQKIAAGALPFSMEARNYSTISPTLGAGALEIMVTAGLLAFLIICILLILYYKLPGIIACVALLLQVSGQLLALSIPQITLTLPGIAGVILSIGMGVDANIIIGERISEEIQAGKKTPAAIAAGFKNAFSSVFDGNITVMIVSIILMVLGSGAMLSFAYSLLTGVLLNFLAGVTASRLMMRSLSQFKPLSKESLYTSRSRRITITDKFFSFNKHRRMFFLISAALIAIGVVAVVADGVQLDIQFTGGAILKYTYQGELNAEEVADAASGLLGRTTSAQLTNDLNTGENRVVLNLAGEYGMSAEEQDKFLADLNAQFPTAQFVSAESSLVQPFFGQRFLVRSAIAVLLALLLILIYEWITFRKIGGLLAGLTALIALFHDLAMVFITCVIAGIPIGDSFVAVALSIIGYSINDTIVVFDRIRENRRLYPKEPIDVISDLSVRQSMTRSINTNVAVTISVSLIYFLAMRSSLDSVIAFALPMTVGSISGCYSTVCLCGPLWSMMQKRREKKHPEPAKA